MLTCANCRHANPDGAKFCMECATPLAGRPPKGRGEERKVVTALFCDLVGFTATSESADPEDVDKMLGAYFEMARAAIEAFGGTVEKFIGDAVVGVFGVPAAHEDDPERAVRAGLRLCEDAEELTSIGGAPLKLRVGVNTGEALVRLGVSAASGEGFLTGDSINTASRIQSVAPEMGVAVGLTTYEATSAVFDYDELEPATLKGKSEPVRVFHARSSRARFGTDLTRTHDTPFVGREIDLALLKGVFDKTVSSEAPQLVTVIGEPGLGKSRIVTELFGYVETSPELVTWRQGRCLPYGEGITFWALGEILKAHAGILDSDPPDVASTKLDLVLPEGDERPWFRQRLLPLLGIEASSSAEREELFTAWRRFLEHLAEQGPTVLVFEDLHWADDAMLAFLEHLADRAEAVPLLVIGTARPELFERHPDYGRLRNATPINLAPLTEDETAQLVSALLETAVIPAEIQQPILDRAGGNPLYTEEFARLLKDRDLLVKKGANWELREGAEIPFPDSVQALIAARLDTLSPDSKSLLADAAVIGKVFWAGGVAAMGERDPEQVTDALRELSRKELVRPIRRSSIEGEAEYAFWHVLTRDVAYGQLPRASRADRHVAAARWIESTSPERVEDLSDVLAYHYGTALELARAAGQTERAAELEAPALRFLSLAGERALGLDTAAALSNLERALGLTPPEHPARAETLALFGEAAVLSARPADGVVALDEAIGTFRARGDLLAAARVIGLRTLARQNLNESSWDDLDTDILELLESMPPSPQLVAAVCRASENESFNGRPEEGLALAERALSISDGIASSRQAPLFARSIARCCLGDPRGVEDDRAALALAIQAGGGRFAAAVYHNMGQDLWNFEGPAVALDTLHEGLNFAKPRGLSEMVLHLRAATLGPMLDLGRLDEIVDLAQGLRGDAEAAGAEMTRIMTESMVLLAQALLGTPVVSDTLEALLSAAHRSGRVDLAVLPLCAVAIASSSLGEGAAARQALHEIESIEGLEGVTELPPVLASLARAAVGVGQSAAAERVANRVVPRLPYAEHALTATNAILAEADGDTEGAAVAYEVAADRWRRFGVVPEQAFALAGLGRCLLALGETEEGLAALTEARELWVGMKATPRIAEIDELRQRATSLSS